MRIQLAVACLLGLAACGGAVDGSTKTTTTQPTTPVVTTVVVSPSAASVTTTGSTTLTAVVRDQNGATIAGQAVAWSSSDQAIASVNSSGVVTGVGAGAAVITANAGGKSGSATITVTLAPVAAVAITTPAPVSIGQTVQLAVVLKDAGGALLTARGITYSTSAAAIATVDGAGKVTGVSGGTATVTATSEGVSGTTTVTILGAGVLLPTISSASPATLASGATVLLNGVGFDPVAANNVVTIRGVTVPVTSATATQLALTVPCMQSGAAAILVTAPGRPGPSFSATVATTQRTVALGQAVVFPDIACNEIVSSPNARYVISVFTTAGSQNTLTDFELTGNPGTAAALVSPVVQRVQPALSTADAARERAHFDQLERDRKLLDEARRIAPVQAQKSVSLAKAPPAAVGDTRDFFYTFTSCNDTTQRMHTKVIYSGSKAIIWEDTLNTLRSSANAQLLAYYMRIGQIFDQDQYDVIKTNFGDPLLRDAQTDNDGHVSMVFSEKLNNTSAAAYVTGCDQVANTNPGFLGSNLGEIFYSTVPTTAVANINSVNSPDGWFNFINRTVVHEVKHIASIAAHRANNVIGEESWLEEGTARHAEELWARNYLESTPWKSNKGYGTASTGGVFCDFHGENATCNALDTFRRPSYGMRRHFNEILPKLQQPASWSIYGDATGQTGSVFYQTVWSFVRFTVDRYATSEAGFLSALTNSKASGIANLAAIANTSPDNMMGLWTLSLYADDYPGLASPSVDIQFPTWNLRNIYAALNTDPSWSGRFTTPFPILPTPLTYGGFTTQLTGLRGGANAYYELSGAAVAQVLNIHAIGGGAANASLRVAIARIQ